MHVKQSRACGRIRGGYARLRRVRDTATPLMEALTMPAGSARERFITDELVVAIPHQDLVLGELAELSDLIVNARIDKSDPRFGLSLISIVHAQRGYGDDEGAALNLVLRTIRERCAERHDNWVPTIGKNRLLERIDGAGYIGGGGVDGTGYIGGGAVDSAGYIGGGGRRPDPVR